MNRATHNLQPAIQLTLSLLVFLLCIAASPVSPTTIDTFDSSLDWVAAPSDGVSLNISQDQGRTGKAMRLDFDFHGGAGYAIARRKVDLALPENYEFTFWMKADAPVNNFEFKLIDPTNENVWWVNRRDFHYPQQWTKVTIRKRQIGFAWGPIGGGDIHKASALEMVVTAGTGGKGTVWIDDFAIIPLEPVSKYDLTPAVTASSARPGNEAQKALDLSESTEWHTASDAAQDLTIDFLKNREFGGLTIQWDPQDFATGYDVLTSPDGSQWETLRTVEAGNGGSDNLFLPDSESRFVRLHLRKSIGGSGYGIREITVQPIAWSASRNDFFQAIARETPRGMYPRYVYGEQQYWTIAGVDSDTREALVSEDGSVEPFKGGFSIEPFLWTDGKLITWNDATKTQSLAEGYLPIPTVQWRSGDLTLTITAFASGEAESSTLLIRYRLEKAAATTDSPPEETTLFLAVRPFQVNPTWQFLNNPGGSSQISAIDYNGRTISIDSDKSIVPVTQPAEFGASTFDQGDIVESLQHGIVPDRTHVSDTFGAASAALAYPLNLSPGQSGEVVLAVPMHPQSPHPEPNQSADSARAVAAATFDTVSASWREKLNRVKIELPPIARGVSDTLRSNLAYILINKDGPAIQPGSRSYERSWIRDGSLTSAALLRTGHSDDVGRFLEWFAAYQFPGGKVPCCVDHRGADPVPENDSHGELIYAIAEYYRYTGDRALLTRMWPHVVKAVDYIDQLRHQRMTGEWAAADKKAFYGLLPESISHEGYSAKPMHSYWDDFFALLGLKDAVYLANALGRPDDVKRFTAIRDEFRTNLIASVSLAMAAHHIDYIPGSVELGDFDATSTTTALAPGGELHDLPPAAVARTFDRYFEEALARVNGSKEWDAYTPYEWRTVGTFVRLGEKQRALTMMRFFFQHRRPEAWNQWAEVVWHDQRAPKFIGDMPHTWVGSDFMRSLLDMLAYKRDFDGAIVIGAGIPEEWVTTAPGINVEGLGTEDGPINFSMKGDTSSITIEVSGAIKIPAGGIVVRSPIDQPIRSATVNGAKRNAVGAGEVTLHTLPATVLFQY